MTLRFRAHSRDTIVSHPAFAALPPAIRRSVLATSAVLPFHVNDHVLDELIEWDNVPDDPFFQLTFPQLEMLPFDRRAAVERLWDRPSHDSELVALAASVQAELNPHPGDQWQLNVPPSTTGPLRGIQHKYAPTVLLFPAAGQTCHSYCAYCFRWPQFVGDRSVKFAEADARVFADYLRSQPQVTDVLFTGGDPMVMTAALLRRYITPLLAADFDHIRVIRLGTKSLAYWPHRFLTDRDADDLLRLFEEVQESGRQVAVMSHFSHPRELRCGATRRAAARVRRTGAVIRSQEPIVGRVNDSGRVWAELWAEELSLGIVPYYAFVLRDTGPKSYFNVPLVRCVDILNEARRAMSGLAQTARGPVMSASPGKVLVEGTTELAGRPVIGLRFLQARNPDWVGNLFFAERDDSASWLSDLKPAGPASRFFFEDAARLSPVRPLPVVG